MSLDVYLKSDKPVVKKGTGVFVRDKGATRELSFTEVWERYPDCDFVGEREYETDELYTDNITHNLTEMADKAGLYEYLWRPEELGITKASQLIEPLREGLHRLKSSPETYKEYNPSNGWGDYNGLVRFVTNYLDACYQYPDANVLIDR